ncbi:MAG: 3-phosphoshikimate 1-carboxyvinyltransferase [Solobacterium sp.]|nr:3-phosphoshikimate 1-carboxyvinyltransferase [Solobacterium sp.]
MKAVITPGRSEGSAVRIPSSKSLSHRALIAASLAKGESEIRNLVENNDTEATMNCLKQLGAEFTKTEDGVLHVKGTNGVSDYTGELLDCGESGSTLRFLIPLFSLTGKEVRFTGHGKLMSRPQSVYEELFRERGLRFEQEGEILRIKGALPSGSYRVKGDISSQFISGLLFALPLLDGASTITVIPPYESRSYVGLTEDVLALSGIHVKDALNKIRLLGYDQYQPIHTVIDGDDSQGAFFAVLALVSGMPLTVEGMRHESRQGDHVIIRLIEAAGGRSIPVEGGYRFEPGKTIKPFEADLSDCPDLGPVLFALAAMGEGTSTFRNCARLRIKESDRIACMKEELEKLGAVLEEYGDTVLVTGSETIRGNVTLSGHNDHRIVMALSVLACAAEGPVTIEGAEAVAKSYPDFFKDFEKAGGKVTTI